MRRPTFAYASAGESPYNGGGMGCVKHVVERGTSVSSAVRDQQFQSFAKCRTVCTKITPSLTPRLCPSDEHANALMSENKQTANNMGTSCMKQDCNTNTNTKAKPKQTNDKHKTGKDSEDKLLPDAQVCKNNFYHCFLSNNQAEAYRDEDNVVVNISDENKPRKRKERQDSTSSITQERKLVRSNSEERLPDLITDSTENIRRVVSHEDFKKYPKVKSCTNLPLHEHNDRNGDNCHDNGGVAVKFSDSGNFAPQSDFLNEFQKYRKNDSSPARSRFNDFSPKLRISPNRDIYLARRDDSDECENEKRRHTERFSRMRHVPGRKNFSKLRKNGHKASKLKHSQDENDSGLYNDSDKGTKFINKDYFYGHSSKKSEHVSLSSEKLKRKHIDEKNLEFTECFEQSKQSLLSVDKRECESKSSGNDSTGAVTPVLQKGNDCDSTFPWNGAADVMPTLSAEKFCSGVCDQVVPKKHDHVVKMTEGHARKYEFHSKALRANEDVDQTGPKSQHFPQKVQVPEYVTPEVRLKQISKKIASLKKKISKYEDQFEYENGYRASQVDKLADKNMKKICTDIQVLRQEKMQLKIDPMSAMLNYNTTGDKTVGGSWCVVGEEKQQENKLKNMKETLVEIEKRLDEKRMKNDRPLDLDTLSYQQLLDEKVAMQKALLYLESLYGRPTTRDERDVAHPIYDRYRILKRMVARGNIAKLNSSVSELATILEHETMDFVTSETPSLQSPPAIQNPAAPTTITEHLIDITANNSAILSKMDNKNDAKISGNKVDESPSSIKSADSASTSTSSINENLHILPLADLEVQLVVTRDEKKQLRRTIKEFEHEFEITNGRKMLKDDRTNIESTYAIYKQTKAKLRLLEALVNKQKCY